MYNFWTQLDPKDEQREVERQLKKVGRDIERDRKQIERDMEGLEIAIEKLAKKGNNEGCRVLAKQLVQLRRRKQLTYIAQGKVQSIVYQNKVMKANAKLAGAVGTAGKTMADMSRLMKKSKQIATTITNYPRENMKMYMTDEMINDALDDILRELGDEKESDMLIIQALDEIGTETNKKAINAPCPSAGTICQTSKPKGITDDEIEAKLAKLRANDTLDDASTNSRDVNESDNINTQALNGINLKISGQITIASPDAGNIAPSPDVGKIVISPGAVKITPSPDAGKIPPSPDAGNNVQKFKFKDLTNDEIKTLLGKLRR